MILQESLANKRYTQSFVQRKLILIVQRNAGFFADMLSRTMGNQDGFTREKNIY